MDRSSGDLYVVDGNNAVVDKYGPDGAFISSFGGPGSADGQLGQAFFFGASGVAVDQSDGDVYVTDNVDNRVEKFDSSGLYLSQFNGTGTPAGSFSTPTSVAVDPTDGSVYVVDAGNNVVDKFDSSGNVVSGFGANGAIGGFAFPTFNFPPSGGLAVDSTGRLYVGDPGHNVVDAYDSSGGFQGRLGASRLTEPSELAVDSSDDVFVVDSSGQSIVTFDSGGNHLATLSTNVSFASLRGVAVAGDGVHLYVSTTSPYGSSRVLIFALVTLPDVTTAAPSSVQQTAATLEGAVNPDGVQLTDCHFQYTDETDFQTNGYAGSGAQTAPCVPTTGSIPADHSDHNITADLTGLSANTVYHFRLLAANANGSGHGQDLTFRTPGPPVIDGTSVADVTETEAILKGKVNPESFDTTYRFEYGITIAYGVTAPLPDGALAAGSSDQLASAPINGLSPGTTYHFRVVAQSAEGTTEGQDHTFSTYAAPVVSANCPNEALRAENNFTVLPDCRAYELVTPSQKDGYGVGLPNDQADAVVAADGRHVEYSPNGTGSFGDATNAFATRFVATRGSSSWESTFVGLPAPAHPELEETAVVKGASRDLSRIFYESPVGLDPLDQNSVTDVYARNPAGSVFWISQSGALSASPISSDFAGASADGSHVLFQTKQALTSAAQSLVAGKELYERVGEATNLVGVKTDGSLTSGCGAIAGSGDASQIGGHTTANAISGDGSRIFFESPDPQGSGDSSCSPAEGGSQPVELYLRQGATTTTEISLSERTGSGGTPAPDGATYQGASTDGSRVFFTSPDQLTDDAAVQPGEQEGLYVYDIRSGTLKFIASGASLTAQGGQPMISDDASHVYFLGSVPGSGPGGKNLYLWDEGNVSYISPAPAPQTEASPPPDARMASGGSVLAFTAGQNLTAYDSQGRAEIYLYQAADESLTCISCDPTNATSPSSFSPYATPNFGGTAEINSGRAGLSQAVSSDGRMVFFETPIPLVARDTNTGANPSCIIRVNDLPTTGCDVYEYENGMVRLISTGAGRSSHLVGVSSDGADVVINTTNRLVPQDRDGGYGNLFDARIDGGFPFRPPPTPCGGEGCRSTSTPQTIDQALGSVRFLGPPNPSTRGQGASGRVGVLHKKSSRSSLLLTVSIPARGRIRITGAGLDALSKTIAKAGSYRLVVALTGREKRLLEHRHNLTLRVRLAFVASDGSQSSTTVRVTVKA